MKKQTNQNTKRRSAGFTLTEVLVCVVILGLTSAIVAEGIRSAQKTATNITETANAQILLSTGITALRHRLGTATEVNITNDENTGICIAYRTSANGTKATLTNQVEKDEAGLANGGGILLSQIYESGEVATEYLLVTKEASTKGMVLTFDGASYTEDGVITITGIQVQKNGEVLAEQDVLKIQSVTVG